MRRPIVRVNVGSPHMRVLTTAFILVAIACGAPDAAGPRFGGTIATIDGHRLELVVHASGEVELHAPLELSSEGATVVLRDEHDRARAIATTWVPALGGFVGKLEGSTPQPGDAELVLLHEGRSVRATVRIDRILPAPEHGGAVVWLASRAVEVVVGTDGRAVVHTGEHFDGELTLGIPGSDERIHPLPLEWNGTAYEGRLEGLTPRPGVLSIVLSRGGTSQLGRGMLASVAGEPSIPDPPPLELELPQLGSELPAIIAVPPPQ
jgi:hypothetical protein